MQWLRQECAWQLEVTMRKPKGFNALNCFQINRVTIRWEMSWTQPYFHTRIEMGGGSDGKESACNAKDLGLIPGLERSPGEGNSYPLQYSCLENSMDGGAWQAAAHGVAKSQTWLTFTSLKPLIFPSLKKWGREGWASNPGLHLSDWPRKGFSINIPNSHHTFVSSFDPWIGKIPWRRERLPTPVFWPREFHGLYSPQGCKESDTNERLSLSHFKRHSLF